MFHFCLPNTYTNITVNVTDGKGSFEYLAGVEGIYNLTYIFDENATHYAVTNMSFVNVTDFNVTVNKTLITTDVIYVGSEDVEFYIVVTNNGNYTIDRVVVFDDNHTGLVLTSGSYGSWTYNGSAWIYDGSLAAGQSASLLVKFNATDAGNYTNYVVVDLNNGSGNVSDNASYDIEKFSQVISVEDIVCYPGSNNTIRFNVTSNDGKAFNGTVIVKFDDGTNVTVNVIDGILSGEGSTTVVFSIFVPPIYHPTNLYPIFGVGIGKSTVLNISLSTCT